MRFANPPMLWLVAVTVPLLSLFLWLSWRKKQALIAQFVQSRLLAQLTVGVSRTLQKSRLVLVVAATALLLLSLAQPQWGVIWEEAKQKGLDIVVAVDTSRSMMAEDIRPNRLARSKLAAMDLMRLARQDRLGLVAFAGSAFLQCPLTLDEDAFRQSVNALEPGIIPQPGTALHEAINAALGAFEDDSNHKVLVLFTDGEDHESGIEEAIEAAKKKHLRIFTIGVGTPSGELLKVTDENGQSGFVKDDDGNVVKSRLDEALLTKIATETEGFYLPLNGPKAMDILYERGLAPLPKSELSSKLTRRFRERFQWPLSLAVLVLLIEMFLPDQKKVRRAAPATGPGGGDGLRKAAVALTFLALCLPAAASPASAKKLYESGKYDEAGQEYQRLLQKRPDDPRLHYNAGAAAYKSNRYEEAAEHFKEALNSPSSSSNLPLQEQAYYNLGNTLYQSGEAQEDPQGRTALWQKACEQFESALKLNPQDADAKSNLAFVRQKIEELKKEQEKQPKKDQDKNKDQQDENKDKDEQKDQEKKDEQKSKQDKKNQDEKKQPDQKDQQQDPSKEDQKKQEEKKKSEQQKKQEQQKTQQEEAQKKDQGDAAKPKEGGPEKPGETNSMDQAQSAKLGQMTPEQAKQVLDAQKGEEKAMIFLPPNAKARKRITKEW